MYPLLLYLPYFNPRSHEGSDETGNQAYIDSVIFQSTLPRGERRQAEICLSLTWIFQSTLPRGERPETAAALRWAIFISIHAPTRGATHTVKGQREIEQFQSTLPRGERRTHYASQRRFHNFNPRSHEGSDRPSRIARTISVLFQSTLPRGERP